jgi:hypothetical protein
MGPGEGGKLDCTPRIEEMEQAIAALVSRLAPCARQRKRGAPHGSAWRHFSDWDEWL